MIDCLNQKNEQGQTDGGMEREREGVSVVEKKG